MPFFSFYGNAETVTRGAPEPIDVFMIPAGWWSDGSPDPVKAR